MLEQILLKARKLLGWDFNPERLRWDLEVGVQSLEVSDRFHNPFAALINFLAIFVVQSLEHVEMPLSKFVNPSRDQVRAAGVPDYRVKTTLLRHEEVS
jgi:hypothetical protein